MQQQTVVKATLGRPTGSRASRRLRAQGQLPGVIYGLGKEPQAVTVEFTELRGALTTSAGMNAVFTLDIDGSPETVLVRDVQRDPIRRVVTHADFLRIDPDQKVRLSIPIELMGEPKIVLEAGGMIEQSMFEIEVLVSPGSIPETIQADVSTMTLDSRVSVGDLVLPDGVTSAVDTEISVVVPVVSRAAKVADGEADEDGELAEADEADAGEAGDGADEEE